MRKFGLIGFPLTHSFSKQYFTEKFSREGITDAAYELYELPDLSALPEFIVGNPDLQGLNVTIPYKQAIIPYLHHLDSAAARIGAVNVIRIAAGIRTGYNTDYLGFLEALQEFYPKEVRTRALVLGTGGAAKAVQAALARAGVPYQIVSRTPAPQQLSYQELSPSIMEACNLIINTTPLGTFPETEACPPIPYQYLSRQHYLFDLVYNPAETLFMKNAREKGAKTTNGYEMLVRQAEAAWQIWNS